MIIINTPHNPVGKVYTKHELEQIAVIAEEHNLLVMADEVVSHLYQCSSPRSTVPSTTALCSAARSTSASPRSRECGTAP